MTLSLAFQDRVNEAAKRAMCTICKSELLKNRKFSRDEKKTLIILARNVTFNINLNVFGTRIQTIISHLAIEMRGADEKEENVHDENDEAELTAQHRKYASLTYCPKLNISSVFKWLDGSLNEVHNVHTFHR